MKDPYAEVFEAIGNAIKKQTDMIVFIAEHTLTVKDYESFIEEFSQNKKDSEREQIIESVRKQMKKD